MIKVPLELNGTEAEMPCPCCGKTLKDMPRPWRDETIGPLDLVFYCRDCGIVTTISY